MAFQIQAPSEILRSLEIGGVHLILFDPRGVGDENRSRNIRAYSPDGNFLWSIQPLPILTEETQNWWSSFYEGPDGQIVAMNCDDAIFHVDPKTGDLYRTDGVKIPRVRTIDEWMKLIGEDV